MKIRHPGRVAALWTIALVAAAVMVFPFYWMLNTSLKPASEIFVSPPTFVSANWSLDAYRTIAGSAAAHLEPGGVVAVEIGESQKSQVEGVFIAAGYGLRDARRDLAGHDRVLVFGRD